MNNFWDYSILRNTTREWLIAFAIIAVLLMALRILQRILIKRLKLWSTKTKTTIDDFIILAVGNSVMPLLYVSAFYLGIQHLDFPAKVGAIIQAAILVAATFFLLRMVTSFISYIFEKALLKREKNEHREKQSKGILLIIQAIIWLTGFLFLIDNLGYNITTLVAGLGIGGIAIALAAQAILGDLFSYLVIFFDKPFEIGDFIIVQDKMGTIEYIGIKTTRIRSLSGEQLIFSNTDLTNSRVHNYKRMEERRIVFSFGVTYNTSAEKLKTIPVQVEKIVETAGDTRFDRAHFKSFGNFSLDFEVVYYVLTPDYNIYMNKQQHINVMIYEFFKKEGIEFAFPTQTVFINK